MQMAAGNPANDPAAQEGWKPTRVRPDQAGELAACPRQGAGAMEASPVAQGGACQIPCALCPASRPETKGSRVPAGPASGA